MDNHLLEFLLTTRHTICFITDMDMRVTRVLGDLTLGIELISGAETVEALIGKTLTAITPELEGAEADLQAILTGDLPSYDLAWINREANDGSTSYINAYVLPYSVADGSIQGLIHYLEDVTEEGKLHQQVVQHRNELQLLQHEVALRNRYLATANIELRQVAELKSRFVSIAAHELRTPLSSINGFLDILLGEIYGELNSDQRRFLGIIEQSADRLLTITNNLLDIAMLEGGQLDLDMRPLDIGLLIERIAIEFQPAMAEHHLSLDIKVAPDAKMVLADEIRTTQILTNLLSNACKYTEDGGKISIYTTVSRDEGYIQIAVKDTGVGVPETARDHLFELFYRSENAQRIDTNGAGLGLHIANSLVELHGGKIWYESELNRGSTFYFTLPTIAEPVMAVL